MIVFDNLEKLYFYYTYYTRKFQLENKLIFNFKQLKYSDQNAKKAVGSTIDDNKVSQSRLH